MDTTTQTLLNACDGETRPERLSEQRHDLLTRLYTKEVPCDAWR